MVEIIGLVDMELIPSNFPSIIYQSDRVSPNQQSLRKICPQVKLYI